MLALTRRTKCTLPEISSTWRMIASLAETVGSHGFPAECCNKQKLGIRRVFHLLVLIYVHLVFREGSGL